MNGWISDQKKLGYFKKCFCGMWAMRSDVFCWRHRREVNEVLEEALFEETERFNRLNLPKPLMRCYLDLEWKEDEEE